MGAKLSTPPSSELDPQPMPPPSSELNEGPQPMSPLSTETEYERVTDIKVTGSRINLYPNESISSGTSKITCLPFIKKEDTTTATVANAGTTTFMDTVWGHDYAFADQTPDSYTPFRDLVVLDDSLDIDATINVCPGATSSFFYDFKNPPDDNRIPSMVRISITTDCENSNQHQT